MGFVSSIKNMNDFSNILILDFSIFRHDHEERFYPNWMIQYYETLTLEEQWMYFRAFRKIEAQLEKPEYLIDQLKWILKGTNIELEYYFFVQLMFDEDADIDDICKIGYFEQLYQTYNERFEKQLRKLLAYWKNLGSFYQRAKRILSCFNK